MSSLPPWRGLLLAPLLEVEGHVLGLDSLCLGRLRTARPCAWGSQREDRDSARRPRGGHALPRWQVCQLTCQFPSVRSPTPNVASEQDCPSPRGFGITPYPYPPKSDTRSLAFGSGRKGVRGSHGVCASWGIQMHLLKPSQASVSTSVMWAHKLSVKRVYMWRKCSNDAKPLINRGRGACGKAALSAS